MLTFGAPRSHIRQVLQDHAPTMDYTIVQRIIEEDLGAKPEQLFREFDKIPLAAASLAQVAVRHICTNDRK